MKPQRILVVDDNRSIVKMLELILTREGYTVVTAFDGMSALERVVKDKPDLIILDIVMPGMDGYHVCERLSRYPATAAIPVIMLTIKGRVEDDRDPRERELIQRHVDERMRGYDVGATEFLSKPVIAKDLIERIKLLLSAETDASPE